MIYQIENIKIDTCNFQILKNEKSFAVEPKVFDLIVYLVEQRDRLISRDELFDQVWKGVIVSDTSLSNRIKSARKVFNDDGQKQNVIKTIHARGYQFIAKVKVDRSYFKRCATIYKTAIRWSLISYFTTTKFKL